MTELERFWSKVDKTPGCWLWRACRNANGYGRFFFRGRADYAHRVSYVLTNGPVPNGLFVCHRCDNPSCVNPGHFFLGTDADNAGDKAAKGRTVNPMTVANRIKTHCAQGHPFDAKNTLWRTEAHDGPCRSCRACNREREQRRRERKRIAAA